MWCARLDSGGVDYLTKPINIDELRARIRVHLANARSARSAQDGAGPPQAGTCLPSAAMAACAGLRAGDAAGGDSARPGGRLPAACSHHRPLHAAACERDGRRERRGRGRRSEPPAPLVIEAEGKGVLQLAFLGAIGPDEPLPPHRTAPDQRRRHAARHLPADGARIRGPALDRRGKANRDIADILGLSARTVNKHLETIYVKRAWRTASAAVKAADVLRQG